MCVYVYGVRFQHYRRLLGFAQSAYISSLLDSAKCLPDLVGYPVLPESAWPELVGSCLDFGHVAIELKGWL